MKYAGGPKCSRQRKWRPHEASLESSQENDFENFEMYSQDVKQVFSATYLSL